MDLGTLLKDLRKKKGWSLRRLANETNLSLSAIACIESGQKRPHLDTLYKISHALDGHWDELLNAAGYSLSPLGKTIFEARMKHGISRAQLAEKAGVSPNVVYGLERAKPHHHPYRKTATRLAQALEIPVEEILPPREPAEILDELATSNSPQLLFELAQVLHRPFVEILKEKGLLNRYPCPLGRAYLERRLELGLSLRQVAERAGLSRTIVYLIERGRTGHRLKTLDALAGALETTLETLQEQADSSDLGGDP